MHPFWQRCFPTHSTCKYLLSACFVLIRDVPTEARAVGGQMELKSQWPKYLSSKFYSF